MVACECGHTDVVKRLLAVPGFNLNVNATDVSCVWGEAPSSAVMNHRDICCDVSQCARVLCAAGCGWCCCVQANGETALMVACDEGHTDIVHLLLAVPGLNVNAGKVSCMKGKRLRAKINHCYVRCKPAVWQGGWVCRWRAVTGVAVCRRMERLR